MFNYTNKRYLIVKKLSNINLDIFNIICYNIFNFLLYEFDYLDDQEF